MAYARLGKASEAATLWSMLNPINRSRTRAQVHRYKVEPYVVAADVYSMGTHTGRGGWTWYTGSAGWMYRSALESILGFNVRGAQLEMNPCLPPEWPGVQISYRHRTARYEIEIVNQTSGDGQVSNGTLDGVVQTGWPLSIALVDDGAVHHLKVIVRRPQDTETDTRSRPVPAPIPTVPVLRVP
jgi:cyclic beta-1,2-glucan synthetase